MSRASTSVRLLSRHSFSRMFTERPTIDIKKKTGFPKITDSGVADVLLGGKGISGKIHVESTGRKDHAFKVVEVKVKVRSFRSFLFKTTSADTHLPSSQIDKLSFKLRDSKFQFFISVLKPLVTGLIKKNIAKVIVEAIRDGLVQLDAQLADISERIEAANEDEDTSTFDAIKSAFTDKKSEAEVKKDAVTREFFFRVCFFPSSRAGC